MITNLDTDMLIKSLGYVIQQYVILCEAMQCRSLPYSSACISNSPECDLDLVFGPWG